MSELWVKLKPWAVGIACGWVLLAFVFLCASVEHSLFSAETASKIYKAVSDIVLLKWVTKYQTLLAGLAAIVAGAFVLISAKLSAIAAREENDRHQHRASTVACNLIFDEFRNIHIKLREAPYESNTYLDQKTKLEPNSIFKHLPLHAHQLYYISPELGSLISAVKRDIDTVCEMDVRLVPFIKRQNVIVNSLVISQLLLQVSRLIKPDGTFPLGEQKLPAGHLVEQLKRRNIKPENLHGYYAFFDWSAAPTPSTPPAAEPVPAPKS